MWGEGGGHSLGAFFFPSVPKGDWPLVLGIFAKVNEANIIVSESIEEQEFVIFWWILFRLSGEVALPGGKAEEGDADDAATALREAKEEIGLDPSLVTVVASLEHFLSKHLLVVVPIVGILSDIEAFKPVLNVDEVDDIFDVPLEMFLKDENRTSEEREKMGQTFTIHYFNYEKENQKYLIWGLTARILIHAASVVYQRPPDFPERRVHFNLPKF
uniref:Nudix hydrolase domain-containing protein n=1 Tax=Oryza barthii TaxID=65489 RepID=A0A0D3GZN3_9ORYZ